MIKVSELPTLVGHTTRPLHINIDKILFIRESRGEGSEITLDVLNSCGQPVQLYVEEDYDEVLTRIDDARIFRIGGK